MSCQFNVLHVCCPMCLLSWVPTILDPYCHGIIVLSIYCSVCLLSWVRIVLTMYSPVCVLSCVFTVLFYVLHSMVSDLCTHRLRCYGFGSRALSPSSPVPSLSSPTPPASSAGQLLWRSLQFASERESEIRAALTAACCKPCCLIHHPVSLLFY